MENNFEKVKNYLIELGYDITRENAEDQMLIVNDEDNGISQLILDCSDPLLIMEQFLFEVKTETLDLYRQLLQFNRHIIHGAFVVDDSGRKVIFRNTLQLENLDMNELEAALNSLAMTMSEYLDRIIEFAK